MIRTHVAIICNKSNDELRCPVDSLQHNGITIYNNFLDAVNDFRSLDLLPTNQKFEGENLAELFYQNKTKWQKSCYLKFSASKLMGAKAIRKKHECSFSDD